MSLAHKVDVPLMEEFPRFNKDPYMPAYAGRIMMVGPSRSGKTVVVTNMLLKGWLNYDNLFIYAKSLEQPIYRTIYDYAEELNLIDNGIYMYDNIDEDMISVDDLKASERNIIVIDDFLADKQKVLMLEDFIFRCRHKNVTFIFIGQYYMRIPKSFRTNSSHWIVFKNSFSIAKEFDDFIKNMSGKHLKKEEIQSLSEKVYDKDNSFLVVDRETTDPRMTLRKGFDLMYMDGEFQPLDKEEHKEMKKEASRLYKLPPVSEKKDVGDAEETDVVQGGGRLVSIEELDKLYPPITSWTKV